MAQRPLQPGTRAAKIGVVVTPSQRAAVDQLAQRRGVTLGAVVRDALALYLADQDAAERGDREAVPA